MPRHYQLDAEEFALVQAFREATPLTRLIILTYVHKGKDAPPDWIDIAVTEWVKANTR